MNDWPRSLRNCAGGAQPSLLVFDTYEAAGEAKDWIEGVLLPHLVSARWLCVVIIWASPCPPVLGPHTDRGGNWTFDLAARWTPEDRLAYGRTNTAGTGDFEFVTQAHQYAVWKAQSACWSVGS